MQGKKHALIHIILLVIIQWISISVIILNALALNSVKDNKVGLIIDSDSGPQEYLLLIMGATSLFAASLILCLYIQIIYRFINRDTFSPSKTVLGAEVIMSIIVIALWSSSTAIIVNHFNASSSCRLSHHTSVEISTKTCSFVNAMIVLAFITIVLWVVSFVASLITFYKLSDLALNTLFTLESDAVHPYQNLKVEENTPTISTNNKKHMISVQSSAASDKTKCELNEYDQVVDPSTNKSSIEKTERIDYPALPEPATTKSWDFDFHFEPITLDLVLPNIDLIDRDRAY